MTIRDLLLAIEALRISDTADVYFYSAVLGNDGHSPFERVDKVEIDANGNLVLE